eukprot:1137331-Pelagomonas_calceolata.AAC.4
MLTPPSGVNTTSRESELVVRKHGQQCNLILQHHVLASWRHVEPKLSNWHFCTQLKDLFPSPVDSCSQGFGLGQKILLRKAIGRTKATVLGIQVVLEV